MTEDGFLGIYDHQGISSCSFRRPVNCEEYTSRRPDQRSKDQCDWRTFSNGSTYNPNEGHNICPTAFDHCSASSCTSYCYYKPTELHGGLCQNVVYTNQSSQCDMGAYSIEDFQGYPGYPSQSRVFPASHAIVPLDSKTSQFIQSHEFCPSALKTSCKDVVDSVDPSLLRHQRSSCNKSKHTESLSPYKKRSKNIFQPRNIIKPAQNKDLIIRTESPVLSFVPTDKIERVFIWDLELTVDIFTSSLNRHTELLNRHIETNLSYWNSMMRRMEEIINRVVDAHFFQADFEKNNQVNIEDTLIEENDQDMSRYNFPMEGYNKQDTSTSSSPQAGVSSACWLKKLFSRYKRIREFYQNNQNSFELLNTLLDPATRNHWLWLRYEAERITNGWMSLVFRPLSIINSRRNCRNVLVTRAHLVPTITRVLLSGISSVFSVDNIYSAANVERDLCFEQISTKFGQGCTFVVVGGERKQEIAARQMDWPFWRVSLQSDLYALQRALQWDYL